MRGTFKLKVKMLESRPKDAVGSLVKTAQTVQTVEIVETVEAVDTERLRDLQTV